MTDALLDPAVPGSRAENALPLAGDTGAITPVWGIDWLAVTTWGAELDTVARLVSEAFHLGRPVGIEGWLAQGGAKWYGHRHEYLSATVLSEPQAPGVEDNVHVVMPGEACAVGVDALVQLVTRLGMWATRCAVVRLDLAVDRVSFTPHDAYQAVLAGHTVSWVKRGRDDVIGHTWHASNGHGEGNTLVLGRRSSQRHLRIYDKRGPTRIELETRGKYAGAVAKKLIELRGDEPGMVAFVIGCLREFCDFGVQDGVHGSRGVELLPWWAALVGSVDRIGRLVRDRRLELVVDRTLAWVERSVVPSLSMIEACYHEPGERLLRLWIEAGYERLGNRHLAAIREFRYVYGRERFETLMKEGAA